MCTVLNQNMTVFLSISSEITSHKQHPMMPTYDKYKRMGSGANKGRCTSQISQSDHILAHLLINYLCCCLYGKALICVLSGISCTADRVHSRYLQVRPRRIHMSSWGKGRTTLYVNTMSQLNAYVVM